MSEVSAEANFHTATATSQQFATFYIGRLLFGIDVMQVQEIIRYQQMTPVPLASDMIEGLINLRGQIITAIDLRKRLMLEPRDSEALPMNVVVRIEDEVVSLLVDQIGDVLQVPNEQYEEVPETLDPAYKELVTGVYKLKDDLLLVLNAQRAVAIKSSGNEKA
jgi:purine-binding chemotaxis protein CheW